MTVKSTFIWNIDCQSVFQSYRNFVAGGFNPRETSFGGVVFGRTGKTEIVLVIFANSESLNASSVEFLLSGLSADVQLVGKVCIDGMEVPPIDGFTLETSFETLENANQFDLLDRNGMLNNAIIGDDGLTIKTTVGFECVLRAGNESEDLKSWAERWLLDMDRLTFVNHDDKVVLQKIDPKEKAVKVLVEEIKGATQFKDHREFLTLRSLTRNTKDDAEDQKLVPVVRISRDGRQFTRVMSLLEVYVPAINDDDNVTLYKRIQEGIKRRVHGMLYVMLNGLRKLNMAVETESVVFSPPGWHSLLHLQVPKWNETEQKAFRLRLHKLFNLPITTPCLRPSQGLNFASQNKLLRSPHLSITNFKGNMNAKISLVCGPYNYHHYMQDNFDDAGWGCAYRSFQTIWSWLLLNGYTDKPVPTHKDIQKCLVEIGDKTEKFIGSKQWIGSTEIGYVLDSMLGIESKFIITNSGSEVPEKARELAYHFDNVGSPVMIGGAQLAHTILGVEWDEGSGECRFLILDPHYTGIDDLRTVLQKGWCSWKPSSFWKTEHFYNMVLPQRPKDVI